MKIGFCGAGGTGKSSLAPELAKRMDLPLIKSPSRAMFKKHKIETEDAQNEMSSQDRWALQLDIFKAIDEQYKTEKEGVFERTHLDNFFYALHQCYEIMDKNDVKFFARTTHLGLASLDYIIHTPLYDWGDISDGMRTASYASRTLADAFIRNFLNEHQFRYYVTADEPVPLRLERLYGYFHV